MKPQVLKTSIRPAVTDVRTVGQFVAITDHSRMIDDARHSNYAIQYSAPIGPELPSPRPALMPDTSAIDAHWHRPINDHAWLTHADVIAARSAMYSPEAAAHARMLADEARGAGAEKVAESLESFATNCDAANDVADDRPTAARYYRVVASTALDRMRTHHEARDEAIAMAAALTDTAPYAGIDGTNELTADEISVIRAILLAIA